MQSCTLTRYPRLDARFACTRQKRGPENLAKSLVAVNAIFARRRTPAQKFFALRSHDRDDPDVHHVVQQRSAPQQLSANVHPEDGNRGSLRTKRDEVTGQNVSTRPIQ